MRGRPLGVKIFAIIFIAMGGLGTLFFIQSTFWPPVDERSRIMLTMFRPLYLLAGLANLILGSGLVMMRAWAHRMTIGIATFPVVLMLMMAWRGGWRFASWRHPAYYVAVLDGFILWYFLRPSVKAHFQKEKGA